ncbi:alpha/beta hydrolase [Fulvivirgaceae bacterium BMA12]|uniref:Alpha/beta hydrolase n=1 Tax=Agaribacillus aureus TaxID=3051825 RepID=A0ABT8L1I2_9BACT|nr:alpha/beta hydrolase [Fulvivirgaceae bacterium BMA12]
MNFLIKSRVVYVFCMGFTLAVSGKETITIKADDGVEITADLYLAHDKNAPFIVLFHQAGWSRGEYLEIAPKLNAMGFNCLAVDQRSGGAVNGLKNQTHLSAIELGKKTTYLDALPDMIKAINYCREHYAKGKLLIWGSSYSSSLVIKIAGDHSGLIDGALAFAPGEYFSRFGKSKNFIAQSAGRIDKPVFITSAKNEKNNWWAIYQAIPSADKVYFLPETNGNHGSRALWEKFGDHLDYWNSVKDFLNKIM